MRRTALGLAAGTACIALFTSCSAGNKGALVLAVTTDMQTPKDLDVLSVYVETNSSPKFDYLGRVRPGGGVDLPSTLAIVEPDDPSAQVRIRVIAFEETQPRVLRDVLTTVPHGRTAVLRLPLDLLDEGSVMSGSLPPQYVPDEKTTMDGPTQFDPTDPTNIVPSCDFTRGLTMVDGQCAEATVDSSTLPDFDQGQVDGDAGLQSNGEPGTCFDVHSCFRAATVVNDLNVGTCEFSLPQGADPAKLNVAIVTPSTGACLSPGQCFVPLAEDPNEGWSVSGGTVKLAPAYCTRLLKAGAALGPASLYVDVGDCAAETTAQPVCQPTSGDAGPPVDASPEAAHDASADATLDAGPDATVDASGDGSPIVDSGPDCQGILAAMQGAPLLPPAGYFGLDLSNGGKADGGLGSGGITIDQTGLLACASSIEPTTLPDGSAPKEPGSRLAQFGGASAPFAALEYNVQSRVLYQAQALPGYTGRLTFQGRQGGAYGSYTYAISVGSSPPSGTVTVLRGGVPLMPDWTPGDAGPRSASAWANELYDGIMATFAPSVPAVADCGKSTFTSYAQGVPVTTSDCLFIPDDTQGNSILGIRPLGLYLWFYVGTGEVDTMFSDWLGGAAFDCATPQAALEYTRYSPFKFGNQNGTTFGWQIGGLTPLLVSSNPSGLTEGEANQILGCTGAPWTPPDVGYAGTQWAGAGVSMESNLDSGLNYKVYAGAGYQGQLVLQPAAIGDASTNGYTLGIGSAATVNDAGLTIDWTSASTVDPSATALFNTILANECQAAPDTSCVDAGDCTVVTNDGLGHSVLTLSPSATTSNAWCGGYTIAPITIVFQQGTSTPQQIYVTNPAGM